jgi:glycosyltransferase involved in cell wall biosynthesis
VYLFHAKSKSYTHERRRELSSAGTVALRAKHGEQKIEKSLAALKQNSVLAQLRSALQNAFTQEEWKSNLFTGVPIRPVFILPVRGGGGGAHSVVQEALAMRKMGVNAQVAIRHQHKEDFLYNYASLIRQWKDLFVTYRNPRDLAEVCRGFDIGVATIFKSVELLHFVLRTNPSILPAYYIQDYEPWFFPENSPEFLEAASSYTSIPNALLFAKTGWLCRIVAKNWGVQVQKVVPSLDRRVFFPPFGPLQSEGRQRLRVCAMVRPRTPRRGAKRTMAALERLHEKFGCRLDITIFGCSDLELVDHSLEKRFAFKNRGVLTRDQVAEVLRSAQIFIDLSDYQAFGRTGLEAMACGCAVLLPREGGASEYAINDENAMLVDTRNDAAVDQALNRLVDDHELLAHLRKSGLETAERFSVELAALSEIDLFLRHVIRLESNCSCSSRFCCCLSQKS